MVKGERLPRLESVSLMVVEHLDRTYCGQIEGYLRGGSAGTVVQKATILCYTSEGPGCGLRLLLLLAPC